mgnify:CR=1 FL=1
MAKKCGVFVISNKLFFHRHFALFLDYNPVGLHAYVGVLLTVNHWFLSLQYAFARVRRFHVLLLNIFPIFPFSQREMVFLYKLLYINILSFLLHLFFVIWDNGTMGQVGQVVQFCKEFYSLFPLSLAISLRSTLTLSLVIIAILFSRTGKELCRIQLVRDV